MAGITARTRYPGNRLTTLQYEGCMLISPLSDRDDAPIITEDIPEDPEARFWSVYNHLAKGEDDDLTENWDKDMDVLLVYVRAFTIICFDHFHQHVLLRPRPVYSRRSLQHS